MLPHSEILFWFSPSYPEEECTNQTFLNMVAHECTNNMLSFEEHPLRLYDVPEEDECNSVSGVLLRGDIMWSTGNLTKPVLPPTTKPFIDIEMELEGQIFVPPKAYFGCLSPVPEGANLINSNSLHMSAVSYTPDYDHSYNKPKSEEVKCESVEEDDDDDEDSDSDDSSGEDDVDIETVSDDGQKVCAIKLQRTLRPIIKPKRFSQRENVPPLKLKTSFNKQETTRVVAAMLKRTKHYHQTNGRAIMRTKRGRRPANSLPCSPGSSRSNSDTEEPVVKRSMHNNMERMRRNQQRMALHCLRDKIPELRHNPKVSKVKIINKAKDYIQSLHLQEQEQEEMLQRLRDRNSVLRKRLELSKLKH